MSRSIELLNKIESLIIDWKDNPEIASGNYAASKILLKELKIITVSENIKGNANESLIELNNQIDQMFGIEITDGKSFSDYFEWAYAELVKLKSNQCFGSTI